MNKASWKISFSKLVPSFLKSDVKHYPKSKNFENFSTSNSNNSKTIRSFKILRTQLNSACGDEQIGCFSFFLSPFPDLVTKGGAVNPVYFSRESLVKENSTAANYPKSHLALEKRNVQVKLRLRARRDWFWNYYTEFNTTRLLEDNIRK